MTIAPVISDEERARTPILKFFAFSHLPPALQEVSRIFHDAAASTCAVVPASAERTVALRKLLEAKDAAVRAALEAS